METESYFNGLVLEDLRQETFDTDTDFESDEVVYSIPLSKQIITLYEDVLTIPGLGIMGGVARDGLRKIFNHEILPARDVDLVMLNDSDVDKDLATKLSKKYMPRDHSFGNGIGRIELGEYFRTRDFTINECLILNRGGLPRLYFTWSAIYDCEANIVRPSEYEDDVGSKILLKALRLKVLLEQSADCKVKILNIPFKRFDYSNISNFYLILNMYKSAQIGMEFCIDFYKELLTYNLVDKEFLDLCKVHDFEGRAVVAKEVAKFFIYLQVVKLTSDFDMSEDIPVRLKDELESLDWRVVLSKGGDEGLVVFVDKFEEELHEIYGKYADLADDYFARNPGKRDKYK